MFNRLGIAVLLLMFGISEMTVATPLAILHENCVRCHSPSKRKGGLLINSRESLLKGGDSGASVELGASGASFLIETLFPEADPHMPPKGQLSPEEIIDLEEWIDSGAEWDPQEWLALTRPRKTEVKLATQLPSIYQPILAMALSPDGKTLAAGRGNSIDLYEWVSPEDEKLPAKLEFRDSLLGHSDLIQSLAFSPDGLTLASGGFRKLMLHSLQEKDRPRVISDPFLGRLTSLAFSPDGTLLIVADSTPAQASRLHAFQPANGQRLQSIESAHSDSIFDIGFSADGKQFASTSADKLSVIRDSKTFDVITSLEGHTSYVLSLAFGPEGKRIATGGDDEVVKVWDTKTGKQILSFKSSKSGPVGGVVWTIDPDNTKKRADEKDKTKAKAINTDRIVAINDLGTPGTFTELKEHEGVQRSTGARERKHDAVAVALTSMAYDLKELRLFSGSEDGRIFVWDKGGKKLQELGDPMKLAEVGE